MATKKEYDLIEAIEAVGAQVAPDVDIVSVQIVGPVKAPIVRVYVDHPDGVGFNILTNAQKWIGDILDEINPFPGSYTLEVSSPGPARPLRKFSHFKNAVGKMAKIKCSDKIEGRKIFTGTIISAEKNIVKIALEEGKKDEELQVDIPFELIASANLKPVDNW